MIRKAPFLLYKQQSISIKKRNLCAVGKVEVSAMEALKQIACTTTAGMDAQQLGWNGKRVSFVNKGRLEFCHDDLVKQKKKEKVGIKKKLKLLKGLSEDLSAFAGMGFASDQDHDLLAQVRGKMITEAAEVLLKHLEQLKAEEEELKRKKKQEKVKPKVKTSTESESSAGDCENKIVHTNRIITKPVVVEEIRETVASAERHLNIVSASCGNDDVTKKIEVCMGNKCKKSGGGLLLEEFQRVMGIEGNVVVCKCMGRCRDGPNVRICNSGNQQIPANPLFIGVGLEDVAAIVSNLLDQDSKSLELSLSPAT